MPVAAKTPFSTKNPATLARGFASSASAQGGEVVCPLPNSDGSQCRKKCVGNFAYRSICEHIRRAHPDNWIPKLPASPETFAKMVGLAPRTHINASAPARKSSSARKPSKLTKLEDQYVETLSPPSSGSETELPPFSSIAGNAYQKYSSVAYHPYDAYQDDDEELDGEHEVDYDGLQGHTETETEDEEYPHGYARGSTQKRKRQSTYDSSASSSSFGASRWDELIEAATNRAVYEASPELMSPPPTASTVSSQNIPTCPNSPSINEPRVQCADCNGLASVNRSYICTECVSGFCQDCAVVAGHRGCCSECRTFGVRFKPLKVVIRA